MGTTLDLAAVFDRDEVKLTDGTVYELRNQQEFSILDDHRLRTLIEKISKFNASAAKTEDEAEQASRMLRDLADMIVVDAPDDLPDWACVRIFQFWMQRAQSEAGPPPVSRRTTASSSRGSKRSTAATRKPGSKSRPGR